MSPCRAPTVAALLLALAGCGAKTDAPAPIGDPPALQIPVPVPPQGDPTTPGGPPPALLPQPGEVPVTPADKARLDDAEKKGGTVSAAQNGGYEVRIERGTDPEPVLASLKGATCVVGLSLEGEKVTDDALKHLDGFDHLRALVLHDCGRVTGIGFGVLPRLPRLKALAVSECPVTDAACAAIGRTATLEEVRLSGTKVTDAGLRELSGLPALVALGLAGSPVAGSGFAAPGWAKLRDIDASRTPFTDGGMEAVAALPALARLTLDATKVTDAGLHHLRGAKTLTELSLNGTRITDTGMASLNGLDGLRVLDVSNTLIQGLGFAHVPARSGLRKLTLDGSKFDDGGAPHLARFPELTALSATDCPVSDTGLILLR